MPRGIHDKTTKQSERAKRAFICFRIPPPVFPNMAPSGTKPASFLLPSPFFQHFHHHILLDANTDSRAIPPPTKRPDVRTSVHSTLFTFFVFFIWKLLFDLSLSIFTVFCIVFRQASIKLYFWSGTLTDVVCDGLHVS